MFPKVCIKNSDSRENQQLQLKAHKLAYKIKTFPVSRRLLTFLT